MRHGAPLNLHTRVPSPQINLSACKSVFAVQVTLKVIETWDDSSMLFDLRAYLLGASKRGLDLDRFCDWIFHNFPPPLLLPHPVRFLRLADSSLSFSPSLHNWITRLSTSHQARLLMAALNKNESAMASLEGGDPSLEKPTALAIDDDADLHALAARGHVATDQYVS